MDIVAELDGSWEGATLTFVALRAGVSLGTGAATLSTVAGVLIASGSIDLSAAGVGPMQLLLRDTAKTIAWYPNEELAVNAAGEMVRLRDLIEADELLVDSGGVRVKRTYRRGTVSELIPAKTAKRTDGVNLTDPATERLAGYAE